MVISKRARKSVVAAFWALLVVAIGSTAFHYIRIYTAEIPSSGGGSPVPPGFEKARSSIIGMIRKTGTASVTVAVAREGRIVWEEGFGWADKKGKIPATPETSYRLASLTKPFSAAALMTLAAKGLVDLDSPANDYLEGSKLVARAGDAGRATLRHLIYHTSGLPTYENIIRNNPPDLEPDITESIREYGILFTPPGETYCYSNLGYGILGHVISRVSGRSYSDFMREEIFEPLGMNRTSVLESPGLDGSTAVMYDSRGKRIAPYDFDHRGASAILSSARDLVRFGFFQLNEPLPGQARILDEETIAKMHGESGASWSEGRGGVRIDYLLGSFARVDFGGYEFHLATGGMPGATSRLALVPSEHLVTVVLCNGEKIDLWEVEKLLLAAALPGFTGEPGAEENSAAQTPPKSEDTVVSLEDSRRPSVGAVSPEDSRRPGVEVELPEDYLAPAVPVAPPDSFAGSWSGNISISSGKIPLRMTFAMGGRTGVDLVRFELAGKKLKVLRLGTEIGDSGFHDGVYRSLILGNIDTGDTAGDRHVILMECRFREGRLSGSAAAVAVERWFILPHWMELERDVH